MLEGLFRTKSLEQLKASAEDPHHQLKRKLSAFDLTMFGIGAIIGAGIFSTIGTAAAGNLADGRPGAGPALILSFVLTAVACGFTALCYAELSSMIPVSGSAYTYAYATLGELMAWIIGWDLVLEYAVSNVAVAISWGDYARSLLDNLGLHIPGWLAIDPRTALTLSEGWLKQAALAAQPGLGVRMDLLAQAHQGLVDGGQVFAYWASVKDAPLVGGFPVTVNLLAVLITGLVTAVCVWGIKESSRVNSVMVVVKLVVLLGVIAMGAAYVDTKNWHPFTPNGFKGIQAGAAIIFFAFIGFDAVSTTAQECRDPGRDLPRGILWSLGICTAIYVLVTAVVTGMVHYTELAGKADPLAYVFEKHHLNGLAGVISVGAVIATAACLLVYQLGQPRILMAMSNDGLLGRWFGRIHPKHGTPSNATWLTGLVVALPAALMNIGEVVELSNIGTLFAFAIVCGGMLILRVRRPDAVRRFKTPLPWVIGPAGILSCFWLAAGLPTVTFVRFLIWLGVGLVVYLAFGVRNSRVRAAAAQAGGAQPGPQP
ncbi:MAG: amino acid permease [Deltaproteobacteria bacterium]|nr:amino acid permease [Deltaproteobacteria bacterium]